MKQYDAIILGAGAAGLMAAMVAGQRGRRVLLIDHADEPGKKILISGGGRCNFTNIHTAPDRYVSANPHFMKSALARYTAHDFIDLVERHGIAWHEKTLGQLFCDGSARQIVNLLGDECSAAGVELWLGQAAEVEVMGNEISAVAALDHALSHGATVMLSPGQGGPRDAGCCLDLIALAAGRVPLIGVCLGHQAIVEAAGGSVVRAHEPCHGKSSEVEHDGTGPFAGLPSPMRVGRYHSLCTPLNDVPAALRVHAVLDGMAMAVSDRRAGQFGLQFHPESILTPTGDQLIAALLGWAEARRIVFAGLTAMTLSGKVAA